MVHVIYQQFPHFQSRQSMENSWEFHIECEISPQPPALTLFFDGMHCVLLTHMSVGTACDFARFSILATSTINQFHTSNIRAVHIFMIATCKNIIHIIVSCLCELSLHCMSCARDLSKISKVGILNSCAFHMLFVHDTCNFWIACLEDIILSKPRYWHLLTRWCVKSRLLSFHE
jgi:hypothetical protein